MGDQYSQGPADLEQAESARFKTVFADHAPFGWVVIQDKRLISLNQAFAALLGYRPEELLAHAAQKAASLVHPQDWDLVKDCMRARGEGQEIAPHCQLRLRTKQGEMVWIEVSCHDLILQSRPAWLFFVNNITASKETEQALGESERRFGQLVQNLPCTTFQFEVKPQGERGFSFIGDNCQELLGVSPQEVLADASKAASLLLPPMDDRAAQEAARRGCFTVEQPVTRPDGKQIWLHAIYTPTPRANGDTRWHGIALDISRRRQAEEELARRAAMEAILSRLASAFLNLGPGEIDGGIQQALAVVGGFAQVDRAYVFRFRPGGLVVDNTHEWCAPDIEAQIGRLRNLEVDAALPWFAAQIREQRIFQADSVGELPPAAGREKAHFMAQGIQSVLVAPMVRQGALIGFLGFDMVSRPRPWSEIDRLTLAFTGEMIANALIAKQAALALRASEKKFRQFFETLPEYGYMVSPEGLLLDLNRAALRVLGHERADLIGEPVRDIFAPGSRERVGKMLARWRRTGRAVAGEELVILARGDLERTVLVNLGSVRDSTGEVIHATMVQTDITQRKEAEEQLQWESRVNRAVALISRCMIAEKVDVEALSAMVLDEGLRLTASRDGFVSSLEPGSGRHLTHATTDMMAGPRPEGAPATGPFSSPLAQRAYGGLWGHALNTRQAFYTNDPPRHPSSDGLPQGHGRLHNFLSAPVVFGDKLIGQIALANSAREYGPRDMHAVEQLASLLALALNRIRSDEEKERLASQLQQTQKLEALGTLAGGIAHDFNNILAAIMGFAELAADELPPDHEARQDLIEIGKAGVRAKELVRQILTFTHRTDAELRPLEVNRQVREAVSMLARTIPKMVEIELDLAPSLPPVMGNGHQLGQVLLNLGSNAADAMPQGGRIFIQTRKVSLGGQLCHLCGELLEGEYVLLKVSDTGTGMSPDTMEKMFDPFFTTKGVGEGTGLGLSTVFGIVTGHGGHLECQSRRGEGTSFDILFPVLEGDSPVEVEERSAPPEPAAHQEMVLVVDDEPALRAITARILSGQGYRVREASSGEEALAIFGERAGEIDVVIMDLGMPGMGGERCLAKLRQIDPQAKIMVSSGYMHYETGDQLQKLGAAAFLPKPVRKQDLLAKLSQLLEEN